ncbi:helix-turn-helix transcriptional regulator [Paraflavitalea devenefica]|uniref:helix-turn-helix transcriptional regulator n=1 Tax=Paraflavitalea devenefica TaxID=2716334 RepID=UPI001ABB66CC|nr:AraC family transcriptional regulator [Paraflavitalea devenefica]
MAALIPAIKVFVSMIIKSKIKGLNDWLFIEDIPDVYSPNNTLNEKRVAIERKPVKMANFQLSSAGLFLLYSDMKFDEPTQVHTEVMGETITSHFIFYRPQSVKKLSIHGRSRHNIRYIPSAVQEYDMKAGMEYAYFLMVLSRNYYFHLIDRHSSLQEDFVQEMDKGVFVSFKQEDMVVTPEMQRIIGELKDNQKTGELRRLHTEAKIMELLICQLEQFHETGPDQRTVLRGPDIEKLEQARSILEANFANPPTQKELAIAVALNESKLRRGFKEYFATTIHEYTVRVRMECARRLLLEERRTINEAAEITGFTHQNNFSSAFKKYFGISPSDIRD